MKKYSWIAALLMAAALVFMMGCPDGDSSKKKDQDKDKDGSEGGIKWGTEAGLKPTLYGNSLPVWSDDNGGTLTIKGNSSTGFSFTWAELTTAAGAAITQAGGKLIVTYVIDVKTPAAALTIKNPGAMAADFPSSGATASDWGQGKGREFVLGDKTLSNYTAGTGGAVLSAFYNEETGRGWFEIDPTVYAAGSTGIGFQHNYWCDMGGGGKIAENSDYTLKLLRIAPRCCTTCDLTESADCLAGKCIDDCRDATTKPNGTCCLPAEVEAPFVAVTGITGVPTEGVTGKALTLAGAVAPANATNKTIAWTVKTDGGTDSTITGNSLTATNAGTVVVTATITNGATETTDYTEDFSIAIAQAKLPSDFDLQVVGGKLQVYFDEQVPEPDFDGINYIDVTVVITDLQEELGGNKVAGQLYYLNASDEEVTIVNWKNGSPDTIGVTGSTHTWRFTPDDYDEEFDAGDIGSGRIYFQLVAKVDWSTDHGATTEYGFDGSVTITDYTPVQLVLHSVVLDDTNFEANNTYWGWIADDAGLKGRIKKDFLDPILTANATDGEIWFHWTHPTGIAASNGYGTFGGISLGSGAGGTSGTTKLSMGSSFDNHSDGVTYDLNTWSSISITKIEFWVVEE